MSSAFSADRIASDAIPGLCVGSLLAEGGMGAVYEAERVDTGEPVAVKVLLAKHAGEPGLVSRFEREVIHTQRVRHPNVVTLRASGRLRDGRPYAEMELYRGTTLGALVQNVGRLELRRAVSIADQLLAALAAVHAAGIVHRDVQPDNVFLARVEQGGRATEQLKLLDFGFAHEPGVDRGDGLTPDSPGALVGTLRFMSPEQATRARAITERSDLFSTALILYYALTGLLPFRARDDLGVVIATVRRRPIPARRERPDVPPRLDAVLARALAKHPDARFASALEMRAALAAVPV